MPKTKHKGGLAGGAEFVKKMNAAKAAKRSAAAKSGSKSRGRRLGPKGKRAKKGTMSRASAASKQTRKAANAAASAKAAARAAEKAAIVATSAVAVNPGLASRLKQYKTDKYARLQFGPTGANFPTERITAGAPTSPWDSGRGVFGPTRATFKRKQRAAKAKRSRKRNLLAATAPRPGKKKRTSKKAGKAASKKKQRRVVNAASTAHRTASRIGKSTSLKFSLMDKFGLPNKRKARTSLARRKVLNQAAGGNITAAQIFKAQDERNLQAWVCIGKTRTGCGGGAKNLSGSHQIGIYPRARR